MIARGLRRAIDRRGKAACRAVAAVLPVVLLALSAQASDEVSGRVVDARTGQPIADAVIVRAGDSLRTDEAGVFRLTGAGDEKIGVKAYGYRPRHLLAPDHADIALDPVTPRAVHLSLSALGDPPLRDAVLDLARTTRINALVIDVKDEQGALALRGPERPEAAELKALVDRLHQDGLYAIARIVLFKDGVLADAHPELALKSADGSPVHEADGVPWVDPRNKEVWSYDLAILAETARLGFDEIQLDYIRFPTVAFAMPVANDPSQDPSKDRRATVRGFLRAARAALSPYSVFLAADVFGYASFDPNDTNIGQNLEDIAAEVDYICLMLYPSAFKTGLPGSRMPLDHPDRIVAQSLLRARARTRLPAIRFRPWLQAFADFSFDGRPFRRVEILAQTAAADAIGTDGWMLWHSHSLYVAEDLP